MYLSESPLTVYNCVHPSTNGERDCVKKAHDWFKWDDAEEAPPNNQTAIPPEEESVAKLLAAWPEFTTTTTPTPTRHVVELSDRLPTSLGPYLGETKYDANYIPGNMSEAEAAAHVASISNGLSCDFFIGNKSTRPIEDLVGHFISLMPDRRRVFAGYHKERMSPRNVEQAIYCRYLGIRSKPIGYDQESHKYTRDNSALPKLVVLDVDCQRYQFIQRHGKRTTAAEIFDEIPYKPLVTVTNPRSHNCHAAYEITYSPEELANPIDTKLKLKTIIAALSDAIGADPGYNGYTMRGPLFVPGQHKNQKPSKTVSVYRQEDGKIIPNSLYHKSVWYEPHAYTLAELQQFVDYLNANTTNEVDIAVADTTVNETPAKAQKKKKLTGCGVDFKRQLELAAIHPSEVHEEENNYLFSDIAINFARVQVGKYKRANNFDGFYKAALEYATARNALYRYPEPTNQVKSTTRSVITYYFNKHRLAVPRNPHGKYYTFNSETASIASRHYRWGVDYVSQAKQAAAAGIPLSTFKLWKKQRKSAARLAFARHPQLFVGACYPTPAQMNENRRLLPFIIPLEIPSSICSPPSSSDRRGKANDEMIMDDVLDRTGAMARGPPT